MPADPETPEIESLDTNPASKPCIMLIFGASGDLTKRLLVPALYNLACDGLLSENFAILGAASTKINDSEFRERMSGEEDGIRKFHTRPEFEEDAWDKLSSRLHYQSASFGELDDFIALREKVHQLDEKFQAEGNIFFYFATAPKFFGLICENLHKAGFKEGPGWKRMIVEKPFGSDLESAVALDKELHANWDENQIYRVDHYLGKETVQNLLAFRFSNGIFEPLWNKNNIDNIQFNVCEEVDVGERGGYYDSSGVIRDMMQNHMFQMLAYLCMEPPSSFESDAIRNEKAKLLNSIRIYKPEEVADNFVRGQYGPSLNEDGSVDKPGYRQSKDVNPESKTETYAAGTLRIDNWRWEGVPIYLRSGKGLWKRSTEIVVEFKKAPEALFKGTRVSELIGNRLVFQIQPYQGIEVLIQAKVPGPTLTLQKVDMRFDYGDAFKASRYTGYEVMIYSCTHGDATLFSRSDLVTAAWKIAQPIMDHWKDTPAPDFPNYNRGTWGPIAAAELLKRDGRQWYEVVTPDVIERAPLFKGADSLLLNAVMKALCTSSAEAGETVIEKGDMGKEMYLICRGEVEVIDGAGKVVATLNDGDYFGETALLMSTARTATIRAKTQCNFFVLRKTDFTRILRDHPQFLEVMQAVAKEHYDLAVSTSDVLGSD
ncbi:MAG: glucose-6-phosphate dehydrogenase [Luteolibacter sp.]